MLIPKTARKYALNTNMHLIMKGKINHTQNFDAFLVVQTLWCSFSVLTWCSLWNLQRVNCDAMTNVGSCLDENS